MSKRLKIILLVLIVYAGLSFLHVWLNIGLDKLNFVRARNQDATLRVGFLPVT
jgi:hypothetical protein